MECPGWRIDRLRRGCALSRLRAAAGWFLQPGDDGGRRYRAFDAPAQARMAVAQARRGNDSSRRRDNPLRSVVESDSPLRPCLWRDGLPASGRSRSELAPHGTPHHPLGRRHADVAANQRLPVVDCQSTLVDSDDTGLTYLADTYGA